MVRAARSVAAPADVETQIPIARLEPHPLSPRMSVDDGVDALADSLSDVGQLAPVIVRPRPAGRWQIVAGERRWRACRRAGLKTIRCQVRELDDAAALVVMARENIDRQELTLLEQGRAYRNLVLPREDGGAGMTLTEVASRFSKPPASVSTLVGALELPPQWQERVVACGWGMTQLQALVRRRHDAELLAACEKDLEENPWSWRSAKDFAQRLEAIAERLRVGSAPQPADEPQSPAQPQAAARLAPSSTQRPTAGQEHSPQPMERRAATPGRWGPKPRPFEATIPPIRPPADDDRFADLRAHEFWPVVAPFAGDRRALEAIAALAALVATRVPASGRLR